MPSTFLGWKRLEKELKKQKLLQTLEDLLILIVGLMIMLFVSMADNLWKS